MEQRMKISKKDINVVYNLLLVANEPLTNSRIREYTNLDKEVVKKILRLLYHNDKVIKYKGGIRVYWEAKNE